MITKDEFDERMHELFQELGDRIPTAGNPRSILDRRPDAIPSGSRKAARSGAHRGGRIAMLAAATLVGLGVAAVATRGESVRRVAPAVATDGVDDSETTVETVGGSIIPTVPQTQPVATEPSSTSSILAPQDPYGDVATMLQAAQDVSYRAMVNAVTKCMLDQGYTYQSVPDPWDGFTAELTSHPWNSPTQRTASTRGYLQPRQGDPVANPDGDTGFGTQAYQHALYGDVVDNWEAPPGVTAPDGFAVGGPVMDGCRPSAQTQIIGDGDPRAASRIGDYFGQMQIVEVRASMEITATPEYGQMVTMWAACMGDHGYHFTDLDQPRRKVWTGRRPGAEELATATQDASCKSEVGLTQFGDQLFDQTVTEWFVEHPGSYAEITNFVKGVTDRAEAILTS